MQIRIHTARKEEETKAKTQKGKKAEADSSIRYSTVNIRYPSYRLTGCQSKKE